jgi:hypothetical protein
MNTTMNKTAQAAKSTHASIPVRIGRALRTALFHTVHITAWVAYFAWLLVPPIMWFSATPAHSHTATYWMGGIYLIAVGLMTFAGFFARAGFLLWKTKDDLWAGWAGVGFSLPVIFAPVIPLALLAAVPSMGRGSDDDYWWESNPLYNDGYGSAGNMGNFKCD